MLAETLQEWDEQKINEGRQEGHLAGRAEGRLAGRAEGREEERVRLRRLAERFDAATANALDRLFKAADERPE